MEKEKYISEIKDAFPFINDMDPREIEELLNVVSIGAYPTGTVILEEGHACKNIALIIGGSIRVYKLSTEGKEITLYRIGRGDTCVLIVSCLMGNKEYPAIAEVEENVSLMMIPESYFKQLFFKKPAWQEFVFNTLSERLTEVMLVVEEIAFKSMDKRIAAFVYENIDKSSKDSVLEITHEVIAMELGTAREVVSRVLKDFEKKDIVALTRGKIFIKNKILLKKIASM